MKKTKLEKGITLVALIITIVVLLILAVVSIGAVRNSGIIGHATNTSDAWKEAQAKENTYLEGYEEKLLESTGVKVTYTDEGVPVPLGFKVVEGTRDTGLVIENKTEGSQFVWIPVENIGDFAVKTDETTDANGKTNYRAVLYNWNDSTGNTTYELTENTTIFREPANSDGYDSDTKISGWTETLYQENFNKMVESVAEYGGFYVGRYETSMNGITVQSKAEKLPMTSVNWYRMYEYSLTYSKSGVISEIIWGCQWDAMLRFILKGNDAGKVASGVNVSHDLSSTYLTGNGKGDEEYLGEVSYADVANNIYDLEGNACEWTQELTVYKHRVIRGGGCGTGNYYLASARDYLISPWGDNGWPAASGEWLGSRLTLYIEL